MYRSLIPPSPDEQLETTELWRKLKATISRAAFLRLLHTLEQPVSSVLPPHRGRLPLEVDLHDELKFGEYLAIAIETGEAAALDTLNDWMRQSVRRGPKERDWATILRTYAYTRDALRPFLQTLRTAAGGPARATVWQQHGSIWSSNA